MCGITGIYAFNLVGKFNKVHVTAATMSLSKRGPDFQDIYLEEWVALGHRRLSIIDTSEVSNQPMWDESRRFCIVFNGEIFNYRELRKELEARGVTFFSTGDTEVLLKLFMYEKENCLSRLNGFFSFCIYDKVEESFFIARDRYGIKPLYFSFNEDRFIFASEMKAILKYGIEKTLDYDSIFTYLQLNYIPAPASIFRGVSKLMPGHYLRVRRQQLEEHQYYEVPRTSLHEPAPTDYDSAQSELKKLLEDAVQKRLVADVPLGSFLSGGIDSSIIAGLAARHKPDLHTFSIGFRDEKFFDETHYANLVAKHFGTNHTVFQLTNDDLYAHIFSVLDYIDEPFADSSAIAVYILSKETRRHATVALSGDGADELLAGYNKHAAAFRILNPGWKETMVSGLHPLWRLLPQSRNSPLTNKFRQLHRFSGGMRLNGRDRYWQWAGFASETEARGLFTPETLQAISLEYDNRKDKILASIPRQESINDILQTDIRLVLANDMLTKVDLMSMANSLEVRVPFLDYRVVDFVSRLPGEFKINRNIRKRILQDAYRDFLPKELYNRPKKGFEVPLLKWFRREMKSLIIDDLLSESFIKEQGIFNYDAILQLKTRLFAANPGDVHARIWGLIVFQYWWKNNVRPTK
jgi:asparagine synthase (glutamine-hydrolysing)